MCATWQRKPSASHLTAACFSYATFNTINSMFTILLLIHQLRGTCLIATVWHSGRNVTFASCRGRPTTRCGDSHLRYIHLSSLAIRDEPVKVTSSDSLWSRPVAWCCSTTSPVICLSWQETGVQANLGFRKSYFHAPRESIRSLFPWIMWRLYCLKK